MTELSAITGVNAVVRTLTGPRRLRSALRRKTVAISALLEALDGPGELRVTIPAAVFGGDIFGVMSTQLRDSLIVPPPSNTSAPIPDRKHTLPLLENSFAKHSKNSSPLASRSAQSTLPSESLATAQTRSFLNSERSSSEPQATGAFSISENQARARVLAPTLETSVVTRLQTIETATSPTARLASTARPAPAASALESSVNRYWQAIREGRDAGRSHSQPLAESPANSASFPVADAEQHRAQREWPTSTGVDASPKLRSFTDVSQPSKSRFTLAPERQPQNDFNIEVNHPNHHSSNFDDLGDRLAQILHEQALQHGIDVT